MPTSSHTPQNQNLTLSTEPPTFWNSFVKILLPLRHRNFCLLVGGQSLSAVGDTFYAVALPSLMLTSGLGIQALSIVLAAYGIPRVLCLMLGGVLSDRFQPRRVMLLSDTMRALLVSILAGLVLTEHPSLWQICAIAAPLGAFTGLFLPASFSILPDLLPDQHLQAGNALNLSAVQLASSLGPALAGIIVTRLLSGVAFVIDAISFVVSAVTLLAIRKKPLMNVVPSEVASHGDVMDVSTSADVNVSETKQTFWQFLRSTRLIQVALIVVVVLNLTSGGIMQVSLPVLAKGLFAAGTGGFGLMLSALGVGALLGSISAGVLGHLKHRGIIALLLVLVQAIALAVIPLTGQLGWALLLLVVAGATNGLTSVLFFTLIQQNVPPYLLGTVTAAFLLGSFGLYPVSVLLVGFITLQFGPLLMFPLSLVPVIPAVIFGLSQRELWEV